MQREQLKDDRRSHLVYGDQLTIARIRTAILANIESPTSHFSSILPEFADWHMFQAFWVSFVRYFFSKESGNKKGTLMQLAASIEYTRKLKYDKGEIDVKKDVNAFEDLIRVLRHALMKSLLHKQFGMDDDDSTPTACFTELGLSWTST